MKPLQTTSLQSSNSHPLPFAFSQQQQSDSGNSQLVSNISNNKIAKDELSLTLKPSERENQNLDLKPNSSLLFGVSLLQDSQTAPAKTTTNSSIFGNLSTLGNHFYKHDGRKLIQTSR